ncbi:MAG: DUF1254 domain-containing protein [Pseudomonadota bacterium]|nr:DUF1254 domain-containing protein [Pseudomonadota bacterium]
MSMKSSWSIVLATLAMAGVIHIITVLVLPTFAPQNAATRLLALTETNKMLVLPAATPAHQSLPLMAPDIRYAVCRFDLRNGPVRLSTAIEEDLWVIAFYTLSGVNFYTISGGDLKRDKIDFIIAPQAEAAVEVGASILDEIEDVVVISSPEQQGIAVVRAPLPGPSYAQRTELVLSRSSCTHDISGIDRIRQ